MAYQIIVSFKDIKSIREMERLLNICEHFLFFPINQVWFTWKLGCSLTTGNSDLRGSWDFFCPPQLLTHSIHRHTHTHTHICNTHKGSTLRITKYHQENYARTSHTSLITCNCWRELLSTPQTAVTFLFLGAARLGKVLCRNVSTFIFAGKIISYTGLIQINNWQISTWLQNATWSKTLFWKDKRRLGSPYTPRTSKHHWVPT